MLARLVCSSLACVVMSQNRRLIRHLVSLLSNDDSDVCFECVYLASCFEVVYFLYSL